MNIVMLSRLLGWFSLTLGAAEIALPALLSRRLGLAGGKQLVRAFGIREVAAGVAVLTKPDSSFGPSSRVMGDVLDIAVLLEALQRRNAYRSAAGVALAMVLGVTVLDVVCASALAKAVSQRRQTAERTRITVSERRAAA